MHRHPDGPGLIGDGTGDGLPNPPGGICREFVSLCPVKFVHGTNQTRVALLNQIQDVQAPAGILLGDGDHQPEVCLGQLILGILIALGDPLGQLHLLLSGQEPYLTDFLQVHPHRIVQRILGGQINGVNQFFLFKARQVDVPIVHGQRVVGKIQLGGDQRNIEGLKAVVNFFYFFRRKLQLFQLGVQVRQADHAFFFTLSDQRLQRGLHLLHIGAYFLLRCTHWRYPSLYVYPLKFSCR